MTDSQPQDGVFRDSSVGAEARRQHLVAERLSDNQAIPPAARRIYVRRWTRALVGAVMAIGGAATLAVAASKAIRDAVDAVLPGPPHDAAGVMLGVTWLLTAVAFALGYAVATRRYRRSTLGPLERSTDLYDDIERLSHHDAATAARVMVARLEGRSVTLPIVGLALLMPPTALFALLYLDDDFVLVLASFDRILRDLSTSLIPPLFLITIIVFLAVMRLAAQTTETLRQQSHFVRALIGFGMISMLGMALVPALGLLGLFTCLALICLDVVWYLFAWYVVRERLALQPWLVL